MLSPDPLKQGRFLLYKLAPCMYYVPYSRYPLAPYIPYSRHSLAPYIPCSRYLLAPYILYSRYPLAPYITYSIGIHEIQQVLRNITQSLRCANNV